MMSTSPTSTGPTSTGPTADGPAVSSAHPGAGQGADPLRVLLLSHVPDDPDGGASRVYHLLAAGLRERGHEVRLTHLEDVGLPRDPRVRLLARRTALPQLLSRAAAAWDPASYDVVMASSGTAYPLFRQLRRGGEGAGHRPLLVNHVHGLVVHDHLAGLVEAQLGHHRAGPANRLVTGPFQVRWDRAGVAAADVTVVQNLRDLATVRDGGAQDAVLVPPAVHPDLLEASRHAPDPASRRPGAVVWFGTWEARKGAFYVPAAFRLLRRAHPEATLTVGGTGLPAERVLADFDPQDRSSVTVLPRISVAAHAELLGASSIVLFPSLSEGFGLALPEAMAFGCAAVTTATAFGGDHLRDGVDARVVAPTSEHLGRALRRTRGRRRRPDGDGSRRPTGRPDLHPGAHDRRVRGGLRPSAAQPRRGATSCRSAGARRCRPSVGPHPGPSPRRPTSRWSSRSTTTRTSSPRRSTARWRRTRPSPRSWSWTTAPPTAPPRWPAATGTGSASSSSPTAASCPPASPAWLRARPSTCYFLDADDLAVPGMVRALAPALASRPAKVQFPLQAVDAAGVPTGSVFPTVPAGYGAAQMVRDNEVVGFYTCPRPRPGTSTAATCWRGIDRGVLDLRDFVDGPPTLALPHLGSRGAPAWTARWPGTGSTGETTASGSGRRPSACWGRSTGSSAGGTRSAG